MKQIITLILCCTFAMSINAQTDTSATKSKGNGESQSTKNAVKLGENPNGDVYTFVDNMPVYPGGEKAMVEFIQNNIKYPKKKKVEGKSAICYITFIVDIDGTLTNFRVLRGVKDGPQFDEAALDVIKKMPKWEPGTHQGKKVKVQYNLPIKFKL